MDQTAHEGAGRKRVVYPRPNELGRECCLRQGHPVERDRRLDRELRRDLDAAPVARFGAVAAEEPAGLDREPAGNPALGAELVRGFHPFEVVTSDGNDDSIDDLERVVQELIARTVFDAGLVSSFELDAKLSGKLAGLEKTAEVMEQIGSDTKAKLADRFDGRWSRREVGGASIATEIPATHEADLGVEIAADHQMLELHPVTVSVVLRFSRGSFGCRRQYPRFDSRRSRCDEEILTEREVRVGAHELVRAGPGQCDRAVGEDDADIASRKDVSTQPSDGKVGRGRDVLLSPSLYVQQANRVFARASG